MKYIFKKIKNIRSGFVLLYAVVIASIILSIAIGMASIALRETQLSISGKDANDAFFAADTGVECALYLDLQSSPSPFTSGTFDSSSCAGMAIIPNISADGFTVHNLGVTGTGCARVTVEKSNTDPISTKITSRGYNRATETDCSGGRQVERELEVGPY